jgi:hypothetical protein
MDDGKVITMPRQEEKNAPVAEVDANAPVLMKDESGTRWVTVTGSGVYQQSATNVDQIDDLPVGVYYLNYDKFKDLFSLKVAKPFNMPEKMYGDYQQLIDRILLTYNNEPKNLGILLCGLKGTGKSLTAKELCNQTGLPIIIIDADYTDTSSFKDFIHSIDQEVVFFYDEFEKKFHPQGGQANLLSLVEGITAHRCMYVFTANEMSQINPYFKNRPGRIRYKREYGGLPPETVREIVDDLLTERDHFDALIRMFTLIDNGDMNYDRVISFVQEVNMHKLAPAILMKDFNIVADTSPKDYELLIDFNGHYTFKGYATADFINFDGRINLRGDMIWKLYHAFENDFVHFRTKFPTMKSMQALEYAECFGSWVKEEKKQKGYDALNKLKDDGVIDEDLYDDVEDGTGYRYINCNWLGDEGVVATKFEVDSIVYETAAGIKFTFIPRRTRTYSSVTF